MTELKGWLLPAQLPAEPLNRAIVTDANGERLAGQL
jgi:hypothetical protein